MVFLPERHIPDPEIAFHRDLIGLLARAGCADVRMQDALDLVLTKQCSDETWILETNFNDRFQVAVEKSGKPSKWVTVNALRILKQVAMV